MENKYNGFICKSELYNVYCIICRISCNFLSFVREVTPAGVGTQQICMVMHQTATFPVLEMGVQYVVEFHPILSTSYIEI